MKLERIHYSQKAEGSSIKNRRNILLLRNEAKKEEETDESAEVEPSFSKDNRKFLQKQAIMTQLDIKIRNE